jgi:hypothetical protein
VSRTVHGTKKDAQRVAAQMTLRPSRNAGGRKLGALLDEWIEFNEASWAPLTLRDQRSRAELITADPIGDRSVASIGVADVDQFVTRLRKKDVGESSIRNQHSVLRAALEQAVRWEWIDRNPAASAPIKRAGVPGRADRPAWPVASLASGGEPCWLSCGIGEPLRWNRLVPFRSGSLNARATCRFWCDAFRG